VIEGELDEKPMLLPGVNPIVVQNGHTRLGSGAGVRGRGGVRET